MFKARMRFAKEGRAKYISHLDLMHALQRAMARCKMPIWFTEGFHQHAYVSVALPLSTGFSGECEFLDFNLLTDAVPDNMVERLNAVLPAGLRALEIYPLHMGGHKVSEIAWSQYRITWTFTPAIPSAFLERVQTLFETPVIEVIKRSKRGEKTVNLREWMRDIHFTASEDHVTVRVITAAGDQNLSPIYITQAVNQYLPEYEILFAAYHRLAVYTRDMSPFR